MPSSDTACLYGYDAREWGLWNERDKRGMCRMLRQKFYEAYTGSGLRALDVHSAASDEVAREIRNAITDKFIVKCIQDVSYCCNVQLLFEFLL